MNPQEDTASGGGLGGFGGGGVGGTGGFGGIAGLGQGGGLFNDAGGTVTFRAATPAKPPAASTFTGNVALGGTGSAGGNGGSASGGAGGAGANLHSGGAGGSATGGTGGAGGDANDGDGGGLFNAGTVSFTGVTVNLSNNTAQSGFGGVGGVGGSALGGTGGNGDPGRTGGNATGGTGGAGGEGATGAGGGIFNATTGNLTLKPRLGAKKGSKQAKSTDTITTNNALSASGGLAGAGGGATAGTGQIPGDDGTATAGQSGATDLFSVGIGGGVATFGTFHADNTTITGNHASTNDDNVDGTITP